jgi:glycosyltransferase involved in cell wall biosynthesis
MSRPSVSIILPVLNEEAHIESAMGDLLAQDYDGPVELVIADGRSGDRTRELVEARASQDTRVRLVDNPRRRQAHGLNAAAEVAAGKILIRADGHSRYAPDFVSTSVTALEELGGAVGGRMNPVGDDRFSVAVATAMNRAFTMGPARFHHATRRQPVDTVYLGAFLREDFEALGGFRAFPSGSSEDADFYYRWRRSGRRVHVDPAIRSTYVPRNRVGQLWRQYWRYGQGKTEMLWANGRFPSWRPLAPLMLVVAIATGVALGAISGSWWTLWLILAGWAAVLLLAAAGGGRSAHLVVLAAGIMHLAYGLGGIWGLLRGPVPIRHLKG